MASRLVQRQDMTGAERSWANHYEVNDVIRYTRGSKGIGIGAGAYASVVAIDPAAKLFTVENANHELATYDPRRLNAFISTVSLTEKGRQMFVPIFRRHTMLIKYAF